MTDIHTRLSELTPAQRKLLAARLKQKAAAAADPGAGSGTREYPASFAQRRLWLLDRLQPGSHAYNIPGGWRFRGRLDVDALERTLGELARRHESLRTRLETRGDEPVQVVLPPAPVSLPITDLSARPADEREPELERLAREHAERPFRLDEAPLFRATLVRVAHDDHALLWTVHHAVSDGWSGGVLARELTALYAAFSAGLPSPLPPPGMAYGEYATQQRERLSGAALARLTEFWRGALAGAPARIDLPTDLPRPASRSPRGGLVETVLPAGVPARVEALARAQGATPFMVYLAAFQLLLGRYARQDDVLVGAAIANRTSPEIEDMVGFFVNTLVLRGELGSRPSFRALVERTRDATLAAYDHQELPFEKLVEEINPERSLSYAPLVQALFVLHNQGAPAAASASAASSDDGDGGLRVASLDHDAASTRFDLSLSVVERGGGAVAWLTYAADLWERATVERMLARYAALLDAALSTPDAPAWALPMFIRGERELAAGEWAGRPRPFPRGATLPARFAAQVAASPDAVAVESAGGVLTFAELDAAAGRLARCLLARGAGPERRIGICLGHTPELVVALLAVLKSGAAFVPLDPAHPRERLAGLMDDAGVSIVLTKLDLLGRLPDDPRVVALDSIEAELSATASGDVGMEIDPSHLAYVIYTSGSTGRPKGVMVEHGSLASYLDWVDGELFGDAIETVPLVTRPGFDAVLKQLFSPLLRGRAVWIPGEETAADPAALIAALAGRRAAALNCVPALWSAMLDAADQGRAPLPAPHTLAALWLGGDRLGAALVARTRARLPHLRIVNLYGPTEATANCVFGDAGTGALVPIGLPVEGDSAYVVDEALGLLPGDVPGELVVGGAGVARGYLGAPALTAERFVPDPFSTVPGARLYRTGDRARRWADGRLEYLGRLDAQVKVRGVRIEPGEVEAAIVSIPGVREAAVAAVDGGPGGARLAAWVAASADDVTPESLRAALAAHLPEAMVPTAFVLLAALPRMANGKVDRRALPAPDAAPGEGGWVEPATDTERRVAEIWAAVIGVERVGARDDFFLLGGHSLLATQVISRVREAFNAELPLRALFEAPRLDAFAAMVDAAAGDESLPDAPIAARDADDLPLSFAQERLWFVDRLDPGGTAYNLPMPLRLAGPLDVRALERALGEIVRRHAVLRTRFALVDGQPVQHIEPAGAFHLPVEDVPGLSEDQREVQLHAFAASEARTPFSLEAGPLFRARLLRAGGDDHLLLLGMHHAVSDGWSAGIFWRELVTLYGAFSRGEPSPLTELPIRYADFAAWQREWLRGERLNAQVGWWRAHLAGAPAVLTLPTDRPRPATRSQRGARIAFSLPADAARALRTMALEQRATPFMALLAAFGVVLSRWSGQDDVVVGTPVAGRTRRETEGLIGLFVNTLPIRTDLGGDPSFRALLGRVREATLGAYAHQDLPFERLVEELAPERSLSHAPVFQVMLALQNDPEGPASGFAGLDARWVASGDGGTAKADLSLVLAETADGRIGGALEFATDLFDAATAHRLAAHLEALVRAAAASPNAPVSTLSLMDDEERAFLVAAGSATASFDVERSLPGLFAAQAKRTPNAVALTFGDDSVTYAELDARANRLAHRLIDLETRPDSLVGLFVDRSVDTVVGILAILKAGAGYLPLDPAYPEDRLAYMLEDSGAPIVVTTSDLANRLPGDGITHVRIDDETIASEQPDAPSIHISPESLAYVIYTSGSTGKPKGVQVTHANVARLFAATDAWFGFGADDVWTLFHSYAFDFSVWEIWGALLHGGRLVVVPFDVSRSPEEFYSLLESEGVTVLNQTPSAFRQLMRADEVAAERGEMRELALRHVVFGGEALDPATLRGWVERRGDDRPHLVNMYGITETTVHVTHRVIRAADTVDGSASPIGVPIPDLAVHLLGHDGRLVPTGLVGEMHVGGAGVARGYLHRPALTAQRFVPDPFSTQPGARLYRSGDLARRLADGSLEFQGRADDQVKVRGFRIEPGEIESVLLAHPSVREAVVLPRGEGEERRLVAWVVSPDGVDAAALRSYLAAHLPDYMVPSAFVFLGALPLTRHGKVDRRALPEPDAAGLAGAGYVAPRTPTEELLAAVWAELLGAARVGVDDGFFELGGHSLLATRVASRVRETLAVELPVRAVFEHPTLGALAAEVDRLRRGAQGVEAPPIRPADRGDGDLPLSFAQERLWFVDRMEAGSATYHMPLFARLEGELDTAALRRALDELARRHESLRTHFPLVDGLPVQRVSPPAPVELFTHDYGALREDERDDEAQRLVREHARIPFTLETGPLFRADLARLGEGDHLLLLTLHHVIADGWSLDLLWRELAALYSAFARGEPSPLAQPAVQYGDFAAWQRGWLRGKVLARQLAYWRRALEGAPPLLRLPTDRPRPAVQTHNAAVEAALLPREQANAVLALARREGATLFMVLLAGLDVVLSRLTGDDDVVVGTPIAGRTRAETEGVVGLFLNSLALRVELGGDPAFRELLGRVREATLGAYAHQDVPFEAVLEEIHPERAPDRTPVFQVMLNLANFAADAGGGAGEMAGLTMHTVDRGGPLASKFDLTLYAGETASGIALHLVYNPDLFDAARMRALLAQVAGVLEQAAADPARPLSALSLAVDEGASASAGERAVRTPTGAPAGVGELGEVWVREEDAEWRRTAERGRHRPDGAVEIESASEDREAGTSPLASPALPTSSSASDGTGETTETERAVLEIWREVLDVGEVGVSDDFFDLGGHSILGVRLLALVKKRLGVTLPLTALFAHPTPAGLAAAVEGAGKAREFHYLIPLGNAAVATLPPLFCLHAAGGTIFRYRELAARLGPARMVYALQAAGVSDGHEPMRSVDLMAERYLEEVRRVQPHGPYHLAGWSAGGVTAVEMAHRLRAAGEEVAFVGLFDTSPPNAEFEIPDPVQMYLRLASGLTGAEGTVLDALGAELEELPIGDRLEHLARWLALHGTESRVSELDGLRPVVEVFRANVAAARRHALAPYPGELTLFCAEWGRGNGWEAAGLPDLWRPYAAGGLRVEVVPGTHVNMIGEPFVDILAEVIEEVISGVPAGAP